MSADPEVDSKEKTANVIGACSGFLVDVASAGLRYTTSTQKEELPEEVGDFLAKLEATRGAGGIHSLEDVYNPQRIHGKPAGPGEMMRLRNIILQDMAESVKQAISEEQQKLEHSKKDQPRKDLLTRFALLDTRKGSIAIVVSLVMLLLTWEFAMYAIKHDESCSAYNDGFLTCFDAKSLVWEGKTNCNDYRCAAPWAPGPGSQQCDTCNCNTFCDACEQCLCQSTASGINFCRAYEVYPGQWRLHGRNIILIVLFVALFLALGKFLSSFVITTFLTRERTNYVKSADESKIRIKELTNILKDIRKERHCPEGWRQDEPRDQFLRRMKSSLPLSDYNRLRTEASGGVGQPDSISINTKELVGSIGEHAAKRNIRVPVTGKKNNVHRRTALPSTAPDLHPRRGEASPVRGTRSSKYPFWLDDTDEVALSAYGLYQDLIKECDVTEPTRRMLYGEIVAGQPPAVMLSELHMQDIMRLVQENGLYDDTLSCRDWINEWVQVHRNMTSVVLDGHTRREMNNLRPPEAPRSTLSNIKSVVSTIAGGGGDDSDESDDEPPPRKDASPFEAFVFSFPYLNAMFRGQPAPTKAEAVSQREAIMKTINSLQSFAQEPEDDDDDDSN
eukprot:TRINITY_DN467_c4_g1_i1.p1 TRINITY_DN467_c4_g1~~TRINITY_DN467_c4_g1_i1.p1  ORF type:complete len:629 (+),score=95.70 TRINITY_DN467_c4_g1_i1:37-1887(+)